MVGGERRQIQRRRVGALRMGAGAGAGAVRPSLGALLGTAPPGRQLRPHPGARRGDGGGVGAALPGGKAAAAAAPAIAEPLPLASMPCRKSPPPPPPHLASPRLHCSGAAAASAAASASAASTAGQSGPAAEDDAGGQSPSMSFCAPCSFWNRSICEQLESVTKSNSSCSLQCKIVSPVIWFGQIYDESW
jgi:hypothetical protein